MSGDGEENACDSTEDREDATVGSLRRRKIVKCAKNKIEQASELIKRKIPCAGHFLAPKRLWLRRVSTPNCDVVIVFPPGTEQDSVLMWLLSRLRQSSGLSVHVRHHASTQSSAFYLSAPFSVLLKAAEIYHLPKSLKCSKGGGLKEFSHQDFQNFEGSDNEQIFFTTEEREWLVLRILESIRAKPSDVNALPDAHLLEGQPIVPKCLTSGIISQVFPLHDAPALEKLQNNWVRDIWSSQPLDDICRYFGVKIGMYFAWLGHYTTALSIPAVVGFFFWMCCNGKHQTLEDVGYVLFSVFNVVWVTTYLQAWKRYSSELAFRWGTLDQRDDLLAEPRPLFRVARHVIVCFQGPLHPSPVTGRLEPWQPTWKRHVFRYCVTVPVIAFCLLSVFFVMIVSLQIQDWWDSFLELRGFPLWLGYLPKIMLAVVISLMDDAYFRIAIWLNDKENYRLETKYENHLIGKVALFQFVNSFLSLFYIAFYLQDQARLKEQLAALLISRQVIGNLKESALPYMLEHMRLAKMSFDLWGALSPIGARQPPGVPESERGEQTSETKEGENGAREASAKRTMSQAELESSLYKYDGTFADHLEMTIQLGYVILFSSAFPLAALCAMFNNLIEIRSDAFKLVYVCQRPFGQRVPNIGTWQNCMEYMSIVAVLVNCALIGLSGQVHRMFPDMTATQTILLIVALEHIMLCIRFIITCAIPELPGWLATEMAKIEWARREASKTTTTATPSPEETAKTIGRFSVSPSHSLVTTSDAASKEPLHKDISPVTTKTSAAPTPVPTPTTPAPQITHHHKPLSITPDSIQPIPPYRPRKSKEWMPVEGESSHHLTIGPSGGIEWTKKLREESEIHKSTDCITPKDSSSSDSDLLRNNPLWPPRPRSPSGGSTSPLAKAKPSPAEPSLSDSTRSVSSQEAEEQAKAAAAEELAAKKTRVKQSLMKRARSVAIFSLKLKERRAREAQEKAAAKPAVTPTAPHPPHCGGGELSCIPIEKLIQLEDLKNTQALKSNNQSGTL